MSSIRYFIQAVVFAVLLPAAGLAAWDDHRQGRPTLDYFPSQLIGATPQTGAIVQDAKGRLFVGSDALLVYDGASWTSQPLPDSYNLSALCFGAHNRLWAGAHNQVGYYTETATGTFEFTSLIAKLPPEHRRLEFTWGCGLVGNLVYFICQSKVLRWDGEQFTVWDFPNQSRLYPVRLDQELWFTDLETGLYRLTAAGPQLEFGPKDLPTNPAFSLERDGGGLRLFSRDGLCYAGKPQQQLCSSAVLEFLRTRPVSSIQRLPNGIYAIGTLGGLGLMSAEGQLLRTLNQEDGLTSNTILTLFLDQEKQLWIGHQTGGIARLDPTGSISIFQQWEQADHASILQIVQANDTLLAVTDAGLFRLETNRVGFNRFSAIHSMPIHVMDVLAYQHGLLLARFGGLDFFDGQQIQSVLDAPAQPFWRIRPSHKKAGVFFCLVGQQITKFSQDINGSWQKQDLAALPDLANNFYLDSEDNLWCTSARTGVWHYNTLSRHLTNVHDGRNPRCLTEASQVTGYGQNVYFFTTREGFSADITTKQPQRISSYPAVTALQCVTSPDGRRLYVVFERKSSSPHTYGLGRLLLDEHGTATGWTELHVPKLAAVGVPSSLLVTTEDGPDALWVGGSEGLMRIKPDEIPPVRAPRQPSLSVFETSSQSPSTGLIAAYPFFGHHLVLHAGTAEIDSRPHLFFQTRLGNERSPWSPAAPLSSFEFTNLTDGTYTFEVRTVNAAGLTSEPAAHTFRILPPWYRTPWAYSGFAAIAAAAVFGYIRFHERRIRARNQQLESLVDKRTTELVKANAAKDEFLAGISHEIRNPMNGVIGLATIIDSSRFDPTTQQHMAQLRHCATHLSSLLEDILDYSRLQAGAVDLNPQPFDLQELTAALAALTSAESTRYGIPIEIAVSPTMPRHLIGDVTRIRQILLNYLVNALKYSGRGKVCLTIWGQQHVPDQLALTFAVSDDGPGISPEEQARLFTRFERGAAAQTQRVAGTGLGLALCKTLGEKMGGRLWVESEMGQGSTFYFALSLPVAAGVPARLHHPKSKLHSIGVLHALVVDDEEYNRITLSSFLFELGFQVSTAANGSEALALARQHTLHAVFLDLNLPGQSGPDIARELRTIESLDPHLPIIATTAYTTEEKRRRCHEAGMNAFLIKPVSLEKIHAALSAATSAQRPAASFHPPAQADQIDPLSGLRLLASRKGVTLDHEVSLYCTELASEERLLIEAIKQRDAAGASDLSHRMVGRLAFIQAQVESQLAREIETNSMNEFWDQAETSALLLGNLLPTLRQRLTSAGSVDPAASDHSQSRNESA